VVTIIESECSDHDDMTEETPILKSVHKFNYSLQRRRVLLSLVKRTESDCSEQGDMTELTPIVNSVHTSNDSSKRRRVPLSVVTSIERL
jgi:hypothetical protein